MKQKIKKCILSNDFNQYFKLLEEYQKKSKQDTYLLMDNLYEPTASCIDTYSLFLYLKQNNYKAKYVLYEKNPLYQELKAKDELDDIIISSESSLIGTDLYEKLFFILARTKYIILSFPDSLYPELRRFAYNNSLIQLVGIGHGPVFFKTSILNKKLSNYISPEKFNLYLVSSQKEKEIFLRYGWPEDKLINIGLPRFDLCNRKPHKDKNIVIMFTWRLDSFKNIKHINKLKYFKNFQSLLGNKKLQQIAKKEGYNVIIAMHHSMKDLCGIKMRIPDCYKIADTNNLINYINTTDLFITDYSSIVHDFMFLNIPVIFYRLDYGDNLLGELDKFDIEESKLKDNQLFNVFYNEKEVISKIEYYKSHNFKLEDEYIEIENSFFTEKKDLCKKFTQYLEKQPIFDNDNLNIKPIWNDVRTALCVSSSNEYAPYLCVYLKSVIENSNQKKDIIVFERNISNENKNKITKFFNNTDTSIRFINPSSLFNGTNLYISHDYFKEECYYRIAAPKLLSEYDKIIFTDLDLIVFDNIFKLADIDMNNHPIAACIEPIWQELYIKNCKIYNTDICSYTNEVLKLSLPFQYYNTGVVVFDVQEYNRLNSFEHLLRIINNNKLLYQEQCALNILFKNNFYTLPNVWNYELAPSLINNKDYFEFYTKYKEVEENAKILHFLGRYKPWKNPREYKADLWWSYARQTPFYEEILSRMIDFKISQRPQTPVDYHTIYILSHPIYFKLKKLRYRLLKHITFGKKRKRYREKYRALKKQMKEARRMAKKLRHM